MTDTYRALCAELLEDADELADLMQGVIDGDYAPDSLTLQPIKGSMARARAALTQPAPVVELTAPYIEQEAIETYDSAYRRSTGMEYTGFGAVGCTEHHRAGTRTVTLSAEHLQRISDALLDYCDEGPPGEGWKSPGLSSAVAALDAALAQPEPQGPSDEDLIQLAIDTRLYRFQATAGDPIQYEMTEQQIHAFARAVLARWGGAA